MMYGTSFRKKVEIQMIDHYPDNMVKNFIFESVAQIKKARGAKKRKGSQGRGRRFRGEGVDFLDARCTFT